jgi:hypothetical protein
MTRLDLSLIEKALARASAKIDLADERERLGPSMTAKVVREALAMVRAEQFRQRGDIRIL